VGVWVFYPCWNSILRSWGRHLAASEVGWIFAEKSKTFNFKIYRIKASTLFLSLKSLTRSGDSRDAPKVPRKVPATATTLLLTSDLLDLQLPSLDCIDPHNPWAPCSISMSFMQLSTWGYSLPRNANDSVPLSPPLLHTPLVPRLSISVRTRTTSLQCRSSACPKRISYLGNTLKSDLEEERHGLSIIVYSRNLPFIRVWEERMNGWVISLMITLLRWSPIYFEHSILFLWNIYGWLFLLI
jgi:hypothetical protein